MQNAGCDSTFAMQSVGGMGTNSNAAALIQSAAGVANVNFVLQSTRRYGQKEFAC